MIYLKALHFGIILLGLWNPLTFTESEAAVAPQVAMLEQAAVVHFEGNEAISTPFSYEIDLAISLKSPVNFDQVLGQNIFISKIPGQPIHGMIEKIEQLGISGRQSIIRIYIIPLAAKLKYQNTSRTFGERTTIDVVQQILGDNGISGFQIETQGNLPSHEITVQYRETDWDFMSRLLESEGIHYHFRHSPSGHTMVLGDTNQSFPALPTNILRLSNAPTRSGITSFIRGQNMFSGTVEVGDYNFQAPTINLTETMSVPFFAQLKDRLYPAGVTHKAQSNTLARQGLDRQLTQAQQCRGQAANTPLYAGYRFSLVGHSRPDFNREYLITQVEHEGTPASYTSTFHCLPTNIPYRTALKTPIPSIDGIVLGIVSGPAGSTKYVDEFGRVKVGFPWRPSGFARFDEHGDAGWVRVAQIATGTGSSAMWLPNIGDEVVVAFEHGDPRRPVILGSLYNAQRMPPVPLPDGKDLAIFRHQGTAGASANEIVFDGRNGQEQLNLHASRNMNVHASNNLTVQSNSQLLMQGDQAITLRSGNHFFTVGPNGITSSTNIVASPQASKPKPKVVSPPTKRRTLTPQVKPRP